jgi:TonB family protein
VEAIVLTDGTVGDVRVRRSLDGELDVRGVMAVRRWTFRPATKAGSPVPVIVSIELTFCIRSC